jgi:hypothetical protein
MYTVLRLRVDDGHRDTLEQPKRHEAMFLVAEAIILVGEREAYALIANSGRNW